MLFMKNKILIMIFSCALNFPLIATEDERAELRRREEESLSAFDLNCVNRDFASERCVIEQKTEDHYQPTSVGLLVRLGLLVVGGSTDLGRDVVDAASWVANGNASFENSTTGRRIRVSVVGELKRMMAREGINPCHKACMIKCASDALLTYEGVLDTKLGSIEHIYSRGRGECTEFSRLAMDLADGTGVSASPRFGPGHAFVSFEINGVSFAAEPQNSRCEFFFQDDLTAIQIARREETLNLGIMDHSRRVAAAIASAPTPRRPSFLGAREL